MYNRLTGNQQVHINWAGGVRYGEQIRGSVYTAADDGRWKESGTMGKCNDIRI